MKNLRVSVRIEKHDREKIEQLVADGTFKNISVALREAIDKLLDVNA